MMYAAKSLEDIAVHFEQMASRADDRLKRALRVYEQNAWQQQARTWRDAAEILRNTELKAETP